MRWIRAFSVLSMIALGMLVACVERDLGDDRSDHSASPTGQAAENDDEAADDASTPESEPEQPGVDVSIAMPRAGIDGLVVESDVVIAGTVLEVEEDVTGHGPGAFGHTVGTFSIDKVLSGELNEDLLDDPVDEIRVPVIASHYRNEEVIQYVCGDPVTLELEPGDEAVLFLRESSDADDFDHYVTAHFYGVVTFCEDGSPRSMNPESNFGREISELESLAELESRIQKIEETQADRAEYQASEIERSDASLAEIVADSEAVVRGTIQGFSDSIRQAAPPDTSIFTAQLDEVLAGDIETTTVDDLFHVTVYTHMDGVPVREFAEDGHLSLDRNTEAVWFLKPDDEHGYVTDAMYLKSHHYGVVKVQHDGTLTARDPDSSFGREIAELGTIDALEALLNQHV